MRSRPLSLHPLTALDAAPVALVRIAGALGCPHVGLFVHAPPAAAGRYPVIGADDVAEIVTVLDGEGVAVHAVEVFALGLDGDSGCGEATVRALELAAGLGAARVVAHVHTADPGLGAALFATLCAVAAEHDLEVGLEFNPFSAVPTLAIALELVARAGAGSITLDTLHLARGGEGPEEVAAAATRIGHIQLSDGPAHIASADRWREAIGGRLPPGAGALPLAAVLAAAPSGAVVDVEVPQRAALIAGVSAFDRARTAIEAARRIVDA